MVNGNIWYPVENCQGCKQTENYDHDGKNKSVETDQEMVKIYNFYTRE